VKTLAFLLVFAASQLLFAREQYVSSAQQHGAFALSSAGRVAPLCISSQDFPGVARVARHLQNDIALVTSVTPTLSVDSLPPSREVVLVGTLGRNPLIDQLVRDRRIDVTGIAGQWEACLIQPVEAPFPGIDRALVIAGSDKRGTIYGMFDLSANVGVTPWYWWADVPPKTQSNLYVLPGRHVEGPPKVKYRGIFINDEAPALSGWSREKFGGFNAAFYAHVFELILRLKGNYLWPAMWGSAFYDDDPASPQLADEYGVVIGTSHHEPMMRAHDEWRRYGSGPWNYEKNESVLKEFWRNGIKRMGSKESIVTVGMRGDGDEAMSPSANVALLERIVRDQRGIMTEVTGKDPASIPQVWALYKEVQEYYDKGMRVPDDVTLLLCDDNWGNLRTLPDLAQPPRAGGYGIYYHFDFVGGPRNYKWLNTNQIARIWEQMRLAYEYGARQIWIVNVGDIKPMELPIQFFLDNAWNPERYSAECLPHYAVQWARQQFGNDHATEIGEILTKYTTFNARRKPELLAPETYSLTHYREAENVVSDYQALAVRAQQIFETIPSRHRDAFYQLVLHPVTACANLHEMYMTAGLNHLYARQGRALTNDLAQRVQVLFERDSSISFYYNHLLAGGRWNHMMDQTHISYTTWQQPDKDVSPQVETINVPVPAEMGVAIEGSEHWWPRDTREALLPEFDSYHKTTHFIEIFNRGMLPFVYSARSGERYVLVSGRKGTIEAQERISISIDWEKAPRGKHRVPITIEGPGNHRVTVYAVIDNPSGRERDRVRGFVEGDGYVSIEAAHYTGKKDAPPLRWQRIPDLGRTLSAMTITPVTSAPVEPGGVSPRLEYAMHLRTSGKVEVHAYLSPTLNFRAGAREDSQGLRYAISFDSESPQIVNMHVADTIPDWKYPAVWNEAVGRNTKILTSRHVIQKPGDHTLKFWMVSPGVVLQKLVINTGGLQPSYLGPPESYRRGSLPQETECRKGDEG
jgi:hypothetical protein